MAVIEKPRAKRTVADVPAERDLLAEPRFSTAQIAAAAGISAETIRTWFKRGVLSLDDDHVGEAAPAIGLGRKFSGYTAMTVAIMAKLTVGSMTAEAARDAAFKFVFAGDSKRFPCFPFEEGETLLVVPKDAPQEFSPRVVNAAYNNAVMTWNDIYNLFNHQAKQVEILRLEEMWQSVFQQLGLRAELEKRWER